MSARRRRGRDRNVKLSASGHNRYNKPDYTHLRLDPVGRVRHDRGRVMGVVGHAGKVVQELQANV